MNSALYWSTEQVSTWLAQVFSENNIPFPNLVSVVHEHDINGEALFELSEEHLERLFYIVALGKKIRVLKAIRGLKSHTNTLISHSIPPPSQLSIQPAMPHPTHSPEQNATALSIQPPMRYTMEKSMTSLMQPFITNDSQPRMVSPMPTVGVAPASTGIPTQASVPHTKRVRFEDQSEDDNCASTSHNNHFKKIQEQEPASIVTRNNIQNVISTRDMRVGNSSHIAQNSMRFAFPPVSSPPPKKQHSTRGLVSVENGRLQQITRPEPSVSSQGVSNVQTTRPEPSVSSQGVSNVQITRPEPSVSSQGVSNVQITRPEPSAPSKGVASVQNMRPEDFLAFFSVDPESIPGASSSDHFQQNMR